MTVPDSRDPRPGRVDVAGFLLGTGGLFALVFGAISGEYEGYGRWWVALFLAAGVLALVAFVPVERRVANPMLPPVYLRAPLVRMALFAAAAVYFSVFAIFFLTALYLGIDPRLGYSGWEQAGVFAPMAAAIVAGGLAAGPWVARRGSREPLVAGCALAAAGILGARFELAAGPSLSFGILALALAAAGLGFGVTVVPLTAAVLGHVPARHSGIAASATNTARQLGAVLGVVALGAIVNAHLKAEVNRAFADPLLANTRKDVLKILETGGRAGSFDVNSIPPNFLDAFLRGVQVSLLVAVALMVLAGVLAAVVREGEAGDQSTETGETSSGAAPPMTSSTGAA